jgi:hypothetical protein
LPHKKSDRKETTPHFEKAAQIKANCPGASDAGGKMGLAMKENKRSPDRSVPVACKPDGKAVELKPSKKNRRPCR